MKLPLLFKLVAIGGICLLLIVPLVQIHGLVVERQAAAACDVGNRGVACGSGLAQRVVGPLLVVPAFNRYDARTQIVLLPERLDATVALDTELRRRGIYVARVFHSTSRLSGHFVLPPLAAAGDDRAPVRYGAPTLAMGIEDIRGIGADLALSIGDERIAFTIDLPLQGTDSFSLAPTGRETRVTMKSDWPHPSFIGEFLPTARTVGADGFDASWQTSFFATNLLELVNRCVASSTCTRLSSPVVGVALIDPVDQYVRTDRAIKYALLFIALTFAGFLLVEVLRKIRVHPVQYGLVGLALALFFLLLLSLSEHIGFAAAYALAASACVALLGYYLSHVLRSARLGAGFASGLALLYALLYGILGAEDYALLMGSLLLFAVLATFMLMTRRVDWSQLRTPLP
ncbi:cell envelope integrity protein CreD [bacterium]|nr:MAG: cell envelope integrity protein CreD [bacterium]